MALALPADQAPAESVRPGPDPGFGIYVHWPFCRAKCPYCDFNSHVRHGGVDQQRYAAGLVRELAWFRERSTDERPRSVFFGGGTPSLMEPATVAAVLDAIADLWGLADDSEITLEANPTSVEAARFAGYRSAGVNRLSLGVQALNDGDLARLGRQHTADEAMAAFSLAGRAFDRVSFDLIYSRPDQTPEDWRHELHAALDQAVDHLSLYQLTIEAGTRYFDLHRSGRLRVPDENLAADLYELTQEVCEAHGLPAYEISNHARPGAACRHNLIYWQGGRWAGVGPGAHGRTGLAEAGTRRATSTERLPERWLDQVEASGHGLVEDRPVGPADAADELLLTALRTETGLDLARHRALGGTIGAKHIAPLVEDGLIRWSADEARIALTAAGRLLANSVVAALAGGQGD